jgi:hypothetical protein
MNEPGLIITLKDQYTGLEESERFDFHNGSITVEDISDLIKKLNNSVSLRQQVMENEAEKLKKHLKETRNNKESEIFRCSSPTLKG